MKFTHSKLASDILYDLSHRHLFEINEHDITAFVNVKNGTRENINSKSKKLTHSLDLIEHFVNIFSKYTRYDVNNQHLWFSVALYYVDLNFLQNFVHGMLYYAYVYKLIDYTPCITIIQQKNKFELTESISEFINQNNLNYLYFVKYMTFL